MSEMSIAVPNAREPFSGDPVAPDEVFETSPGYHPPLIRYCRLSCHKNILAHASQFFFDMFRAGADGKAVIPMKEPSSVLYRLLILVYPAHTSLPLGLNDPSHLDDICAVHEAANKYQMVRTQGLVENMLVNSPSSTHHPHRFFAIASIRSIVPLVRKAALATLRDTVDPEVHSFRNSRRSRGTACRSSITLSSAVASAPRATFCARSPSTLRCSQFPEAHDTAEAASRGYQRHHWTPSLCGGATTRSRMVHNAGRPHERLAGIPIEEVHPPAWFRNHLRQVATALRLLPNGATAQAAVVDVGPAERHAIASCPACAQNAPQDLANFASQLVRLSELSNERSFGNPKCIICICIRITAVAYCAILDKRAQRLVGLVLANTSGSGTQNQLSYAGKDSPIRRSVISRCCSPRTVLSFIDAFPYQGSFSARLCRNRPGRRRSPTRMSNVLP
ncbi:hypothetical protein B0H14DRAFT_3179264 [Mycena olivaceomarginata]|nr:hypothetical protein B0H14DRAFT_3179264 [Mycena olivaceomarginata]